MVGLLPSTSGAHCSRSMGAHGAIRAQQVSFGMKLLIMLYGSSLRPTICLRPTMWETSGGGVPCCLTEPLQRRQQPRRIALSSTAIRDFSVRQYACHFISVLTRLL